MSTIAPALIRKLESLPQQRLAEVEDFVEFLSQRHVLPEATVVADDDAAYDAWFKAQVQQAIDDPQPGVSADAAREHFAARRAALRQQIVPKR